MALRDLPYGVSSVVYVFCGLTEETVANLGRALAAYVEHPSSVEFRSRLGRDTDPGRVARAVQEAVQHVPAAIGRRDLVVRARRAGYGDLPVRILVSGDSVAISVDHGAMDGGPILELVTWLITVAAGGTAKRDSRPPQRFPMVVGMRKAGVPAVRRFLEARRLPRPELQRLGEDAARTLDRSQLVSVVLSPEVLDRIGAIPTDGQATATSKVTSVALAALRAGYRGDLDVPVTVPVDLRRFVSNARVTGNFMGVAPYATLLGSSWAPDALTARLVDSVSSGTAMVSGPYALVRWFALRGRDAIRRPAAAAALEHASVFIPLLGSRRTPPASAWRVGADRAVTVTSISPEVGGTMLTVLTYGREVHLTVWDESGLFEVGGFERDLEHALAAREREARLTARERGAEPS